MPTYTGEGGTTIQLVPRSPSLGHSEIHRKSFIHNELCDIVQILNTTLVECDDISTSSLANDL